MRAFLGALRRETRAQLYVAAAYAVVLGVVYALTSDEGARGGLGDGIGLDGAPAPS